VNQKFTSVEHDECTGSKGDELLTNVTEYKRLIGKLLYLTITRPDISFVVQTLSQYMQTPKKSHWDAALRVVKYIKQEPGLGILLSSNADDSLSCFCDADWAACPNTRRSVTGFFIKFGQSLISWKSKKQHTVSRSSAEAEYRSLATATSEVVWLLGLFDELGVRVKKPVSVYCDSKAALQIAANPIFHERTKHIEIDCHFVRDKIKEGKIRTHHIGTKDQEADVLTKGLGRSQHAYLLHKLVMLNLLQHPA